MARTKLELLQARMIRCTACPRLVAWREEIGRTKRRAYVDHAYWARPVPGFGDPKARLLLMGLAPGAHGANRTGRAFTGDRSGDFLYPALHRTGFANQSQSVSKDDGLVLEDAFIAMPVRCVPPDNKPSPTEIATCAHWLEDELALLPSVRVVVALGSIAWTAVLDHASRSGKSPPARPRPAFAHGAQVDLGRITLLGSYHVSQQNTQTGRLTPRMFDEILLRARALATSPA